jgi:hypothetical protein
MKIDVLYYKTDKYEDISFFHSTTKALSVILQYPKGKQGNFSIDDFELNEK